MEFKKSHSQDEEEPKKHVSSCYVYMVVKKKTTFTNSCVY